jgi:hypothetical protein
MWPDFYPDGVVMSFDTVDFELVPNRPNLGTFSLLFSDSRYSFEWRSSAPRPPDDPSPSVVSLPFSQLNEIIVRELSTRVVTVRFLLLNSTRVGPFAFSLFPHLQLGHLIEFLLFKQSIECRDRSKTIYRVRQSLSDDAVDIFDHGVVSALSSEWAGAMASHEFVLSQKLHFQPWLPPPPAVTRELFEAVPWPELRPRVFSGGFSEDARPFAWARLLGPSATSHDYVLEYRGLLGQLELLTDRQRTSSRSAIQDILSVIAQDTRHTDRYEPAFCDEDSPALAAIQNVMTAYALYNHDTGYVPGMTDMVSPFVLLFVRDWENKDTAVMFDGQRRPRMEAEAFIFYVYRAFLNLLHQDRFLVDIRRSQIEVLECAATIAKFVHPGLGMLLANNEDLKMLTFMFSSVLLVFKRDFTMKQVLRLWDSFIAAEAPWAISRFVVAAVLTLAYPSLLIHTNQTLGDAMDVMVRLRDTMTVDAVVQLTTALLREVGPERSTTEQKRSDALKDVYKKLRQPDKFTAYRSPYLQLE